MTFRIDYGTIKDAKRTPQGGLEIPADLTRAGVFVYRNPDGSERREWRPMAEVQRAATLDSLKAATLTVRHPPEGRVTPANHSKHSKGHIGQDVRMDGTKTTATVFAQDKEAIDAVERQGWRQLSCGYDQDPVNTPGVVPAGEPDAGQRYDAIQTNILYNHVAIVPKGRAGDGVRLRLDAAGDCLREDHQENDMKIEIIGGTEYEVGTPAHAAARTRQDAADAASAAETKTLRDGAATLRAERDALKVRLDALEAAEKTRADAAERAGLLAKAQPVMGKEWKADGLDNAAIIAAAVGKHYPSLRTDSVPEGERGVYLKALWDAIPAPAAPKGRQDSAEQKPRTLVPIAAAGGAKTLRERRQDALDQTCSGPNMAIMRGRPFARDRVQASMIENQR